nr:ATPase family AAA domain-containing protein 1-like [Ipomoea batatas]GMD05497.1 ATPase family AAA domain-containing protein 1-like [Ipomoea batatas]GMD11759.1 ATPase family AAA domain-containing protein 1-like [Ipomoea batatas]GME09457.1 ATPase family AAA domain-containing protein 1-like [Ipomoea batatas]
MANGTGTDAQTKLVKDIILYAASTALSLVVMFTGLRYLDPNREASKKAVEFRKQLSKRLGRTLIHTTPYEA